VELRPQERDLGGGFVVRRLLPAAAKLSVGPFVFFDHFGPITAGPADNHDVRPHPHVGLATVTYLFEGAMEHRDSTGAVQRIEPGAINWMTAGRGIVHSERTPADLRGSVRRSHGLQMWVALPAADEEMEPSFSHTPAEDLPELEVGGALVRVLAGEAFGEESPVTVRSSMMILDVELDAGDAFPVPLADECAIYGIEGRWRIDGELVEPGRMRVLDPGDEPMLSADGPARVVIIGGEPLGARHLWWNFVSSRKARIVQAADDWAEQRFAQVPGETESTPLPSKRPTL
jgi:redox-sensitive bicupin YhaK (pirin superfamily)